MTSYLLYTLAQLGFHVDIMQYGINVVMDVINLSLEFNDTKQDEYINIDDIDFMEG